MPNIGRLIEIKGRTEGTGYLIAPGIVLTAWHVVCPEAETAFVPVKVRVQRDMSDESGGEQIATLIWPTELSKTGSDLDYALLKIPKSRSADAPVLWGSIGAWGEVQVTAVGYPDVAIDPRTGRRDTRGVTGWIQAADRARGLALGHGTHTMRIRSEDSPAGPPALAWPAMSGSPVFAGEVLIGIVSLAGAEGDRHQLRVLPIDRFFKNDSVAAAYSRYAQVLPEEVRLNTQEGSTTSFPENLIFEFAPEIDLRMGSIKAVLDGYYSDFLHGKLNQLQFTKTNIEFHNSERYRQLRADLQKDISRIAIRRQVEKYENWLVEGILIILNRQYFGEKQVHFCFQSLFWFCRSIRVTLYALFAEAGLEVGPLAEICNAEDEIVFVQDPINYFVVNKLYGAETMKIDLWHPQKNLTTSAYVPKTSYVGKWFDENPQMTEELRFHWSPNDYHNFFFPQMLLRHFINGAPLITDWEGFFVGAG
jgi:hypothetical protein